jgi:transposase
MSRHRLRDAVWASLHAKLVTVPGIWKTDAAALRRFVEAVAYVLRTGIAWEDLPAAFGEAGTAYRRFRRWALARGSGTGCSSRVSRPTRSRP